MFKDKLKKIISENPEEQGNNKKKIENLVFFVVILIITIVVINFIWKDKKSNTQKVEDDPDKKLASSQNNENSGQLYSTETHNKLEKRLEEILAKVQGVGDVKVFINYAESSEVVAMYNENSKTSTTEETDTSGGIRKIQQTDSQKEIIYQENDGVKTPMTKKIIEPKIEGAIITASGASDIDVKTSIIQAVEAATGLATHKIQVFEMK